MGRTTEFRDRGPGAWTDRPVAGSARACSATSPMPYRLRTVEEITGWFAGPELVDPGVVPVTQWRPDPVDAGRTEAVDGYGGVGRKP